MHPESRQALATRIHGLSHIRGDFLLRSGVRSTEYFDKYLFESDPVCLSQIAAEMADLLPPPPPSGERLLAGLELGGVPLATLLGQRSGLPVLFVRKQAKEYGTCKLAEGPPFAGRELVLVEDVITSGGAVLDATRALREAGAVVNTVLAVIDRDSGGRANLAAAGLDLRVLYTIHELKQAAAAATESPES
ncbi:MAG: orotate phosphoribosyltransferase [Candidatus Cloacimonetes bacterium]|nr:orotate phosphoribosyltransferase [Candidatus Cloacimonadota bacterium]